MQFILKQDSFVWPDYNIQVFLMIISSFFSRSRAAINVRKQLALTYPNDYIFVAIDGMDNSKSYIPRFLEKTKKQGTWKLPSKITGAIISSGKYVNKRKVKLYVNHDHFAQGSNMVVSIVYKVIKDFLNEHGMLPKTLDLNLDNCWRENKESCLETISPLSNLGGRNVFRCVLVI